MSNRSFIFKPGRGVRQSQQFKRTPHSADFIPDSQEPESLRLRLDDLACLLEETRDFGFRVVGWLLDEEYLGEHKLPLVVLLRHMLQQLDGMSVLVSVGAIDSAKLQLRAIFESFLYAEYLLPSDDLQLVQRSKAYFVGYVFETLARMKRLKVGTREHKFHAELYECEDLQPAPPPNLSEILKEIEKWEVVLERPELVDVAHEMRRTKKERRSSKWYAAYGGPTSILELARTLQHESLYRVVYEAFSAAAHGADAFSNSYSAGKTTGMFIHMLRSPPGMNIVVSSAHRLSHRVYKQTIRRLTPRRAVNYQTYLTQIAEPLFDTLFGRE